MDGDGPNYNKDPHHTLQCLQMNQGFTAVPEL